jgi:hypothetical protein
MRDRIGECLAAKFCGPYMEVCPHCGEELWYEHGFYSYYEMLLWEGFYYKRGMRLSHYR